MSSSYPRHHRIHRFIRFIIFALVRFFYSKIELRGDENLPQDKPIIFVLNHPNGLLDPMILMVGLEQPVSFLAKSTLFGNPVGRFFMEMFGALPVYRKRDKGLAGGPQGENTKTLNEKTFARCRSLLYQGKAMALFPEGTTHSKSQLLPMRSGAARIALSAEAEADWQAEVQVVPVGLWYQDKRLFRTSVLLAIGQPFGLTEYAETYQENSHRTVRTVTKKIEAGLEEVVLQAENTELLAAIPILADWVAPASNPKNHHELSLAEQHAWSARLLAAYKQLQRTDPERLENIAQQAWRYAESLQMLGIDDPWELEELSSIHRKRLIRLIFSLVISFPFALAGAILSYLPYRLAGILAEYTTLDSYDTQTSTVKLIGGALFVLLGWILEAIACGIWFGPLWGIILFLLAPFLAYIALRWSEEGRKLYELATYDWLRLRHETLVQALATQRNMLAKRVLEAVQIISQPEKA